jgi:hypothetical protein
MTAVLGAPHPVTRVRRRRWPWVLLACAVVVVTAAIPTTVWFVHWRSSLSSLVRYPLAGVSQSVGAGQHQYFGGEATAEKAFDHPSGGGELAIGVSSIRPVVQENSAGATITILRCVLSKNGQGPIGFDQADTDATCSALTSFRSGRVHLGFDRGDDDLVIEVTPHHAGRVRIAGAEIAYRSGLRHATQHTGLRIGLSVSSRA